jgi:hypothetical protein
MSGSIATSFSSGSASLYSEVVAVEHVEDTRAGIASAGGFGIREKVVGDDDVGLLPVVAGDRFKESAV